MSPIGPIGPNRTWRAGIGFTILGLISAFGWLLSLTSQAEQPAIERVVWLAAAAVFPIATIVAGSALRSRRPWAVAGVTLLITVTLLASLVTVVVDLLAGKLTIPFALLLAVWALAAPPEPAPSGGPTGRATALVTLIVLGTLAPGLVDAALMPGRGLVAGENDLQARLTVDCGTGAQPPDAVSVSYKWDWSKAELLAGGQDQVSIGWRGFEEAIPDEQLYTLGDVPDPASGIYAGVSGSPNSALAQPFVAGFTGGSWDWTIDVAARGNQPGQIHLVLVRAPATAQRGEIGVQAIYVHRGRWGSQSNVASCSW